MYSGRRHRERWRLERHRSRSRAEPDGSPVPAARRFLPPPRFSRLVHCARPSSVRASHIVAAPLERASLPLPPRAAAPRPRAGRSGVPVGSPCSVLGLWGCASAASRRRARARRSRAPSLSACVSILRVARRSSCALARACRAAFVAAITQRNSLDRALPSCVCELYRWLVCSPHPSSCSPLEGAARASYPASFCAAARVRSSRSDVRRCRGRPNTQARNNAVGRPIPERPSRKCTLERERLVRRRVAIPRPALKSQARIQRARSI